MVGSMGQSKGRHRKTGKRSFVAAPRVGTYQTRIATYAGVDRAGGDAALAAYAELYGRVERRLFADIAAGGSAVELKAVYLKRYGIPARMYNGVRLSLGARLPRCGRRWGFGVTTWRVASLGQRGRLLRRLSGDSWARCTRSGDGWAI